MGWPLLNREWAGGKGSARPSYSLIEPNSFSHWTMGTIEAATCMQMRLGLHPFTCAARDLPKEVKISYFYLRLLYRERMYSRFPETHLPAIKAP